MYDDYISPRAGRIMSRNVQEGSALVGVVHLPEDFTPVEGYVYVMGRRDGKLILGKNEISRDTADHLALANVDGQLGNKIWPTPLDPADIPVRFIPAFPKENIWTIYGASKQHRPDVDDTKWEDIQDGLTSVIPFPVETKGQTMGQVLAERAAWPGPEGQLYSVPQTTSLWRRRYFDYHRILIEGARKGLPAREITARVKIHKNLAPLADKTIDPMYCQFLSRLEMAGMDLEDRPARYSELVKRQQASYMVMAAMQNPTSRSSARKPR